MGGGSRELSSPLYLKFLFYARENSCHIRGNSRGRRCLVAGLKTVEVRTWAYAHPWPRC